MDSSVKLTIEALPTVNILSSPLYTDDLTQEFILCSLKLSTLPSYVFLPKIAFSTATSLWRHHLQKPLSFTKPKLIYVTYLDTFETRSNNYLHTDLCLLEISSGLGLQPTGTSRKLSSRLSTVTELMWMTWKLGAIPPLCFSLNQHIYSCHKLIMCHSLVAGEQTGLLGFHYL